MQKIFIVDDHPILREGLTQIINREKDFEVCGEAGDVAGSLEAIRKCRPDAAVVDLTLEDGSGLRLIENLHYYDRSLMVLVYSMHDENIYAERCFKAGARGYIMKEESIEKVILALRKIIGGDYYVSEKLGFRFLRKFVKNSMKDFKSPVDILSNRELEVYQFLGKGLRKTAIADQMGLSVKTVETYIENIKRKMNFRTLHAIIVHAIKFTQGSV